MNNELSGIILYQLAEDFLIRDHLFLKGEKIYIQQYDPVAGRPQSIFTEDRKLIGKISASAYWDLKKDNKILIPLTNKPPQDEHKG